MYKIYTDGYYFEIIGDPFYIIWDMSEMSNLIDPIL